jgi:uncharacterized membrane protein YphA (DoxX/SURF4 family)
MRSVAVWAAACILAGVFLYAGLAKLRNRHLAIQGVSALTNGRISGSAASLVTDGLIVAELLAGALLLWPPSRPLGAVGTLGLLALFSALIISALKNGNEPICHCFGARTARPISPDNLLRNAALGALSLVALFG